MKKFLLLGLGTVMALSANAQFTSGGAASESESTPRTSLAEQMSQSRNVSYSDNSNKYSGRFGVGYNMWSTMPSEGDGVNYNGFYVEWLDAVSCSRNIPIYFDWGFNLNYNYHKDENSNAKSTSNMFQIAVPLQVEYRLPVGEKVHISPYLGLIARVNILGSGSLEYETISYNSKGKKKTGTEKRDINYFDKEDMGSSEACWKRFQLGWNIGANFDFGKFYIGLSYGTDFMEIAKKCHSSTFKVGIGVAY